MLLSNSCTHSTHLFTYIHDFSQRLRPNVLTCWNTFTGMQKYSCRSMACFYRRTARCRAYDIIPALRLQRECATDSDYFPSSNDTIAFRIPLRSKRKSAWRPCQSICLLSNIKLLDFLEIRCCRIRRQFLKIGAVTYFIWGRKWLCARSFRVSWSICVKIGHRKYENIHFMSFSCCQFQGYRSIESHIFIGWWKCNFDNISYILHLIWIKFATGCV